MTLSTTTQSAVLGLVMASLASCGLPKACDTPPPPEALLADASSDVTFASVEMLGPHHYLSSVTRTDSRTGVPDRVVDEVVEISWEDWDNFQVRRLVDGEAERETIVADGRPWVRVGDRWDPRDDAEPHRLQLRTTWNTWDQVLASFQQHMKLVPDGDDIVDGRSASRYTLEMLPADQAPRPKSWGFHPVSLQGTVWVDKATAVRLKVQLEAVSQRQGLTRTVRFTLQRTNIGESQEIRSPPG